MADTHRGHVLLLGPVGVQVGGATVAPASAAGRALLAALALADGRPVPVGTLGRLLGHPEPDGAAARTAVQVAVHRLRRWLTGHPGAGLTVDTTPAGYALHGTPLDSDLRRFRALTARAAGTTGAGRAALLDEALALWRDDPLADLPEERRDPAALAELERERLAAARLYATAALAHGTAGRAAAVLAPLARRYILDEEVAALLIRALAADGRAAEAVEVYERTRRTLQAELSVRPGAELTAAHLALLQPAPDEDGAAPVPAGPQLLPPPVAHFTGRTGLVRALGELVARWAAAAPQARPILLVALTGRPGAGKTALAVHVAHQLGRHFPGGRLYTDLRGAGPAPLDPPDVLGRFLRALSVEDAALPETVDERAAMYRARVADTGTLVVLDDAADERQIRPLLPGTGCVVVLTSRARLSGLAGLVEYEVENLPESEAVDLLDAVLGGTRVAAEPDAARDVARRCGYLPLAVRIAAARLAGNPGWPVARLAALLADERRRLAQLSAAHLDVRASFNLSYPAPTRPASRAAGCTISCACSAGNAPPGRTRPRRYAPASPAPSTPGCTCSSRPRSGPAKRRAGRPYRGLRHPYRGRGDWRSG